MKCFTCVPTVIWHSTGKMGRQSGSGILNNFSRISVICATNHLSKNVSTFCFVFENNR